MKIEIRADNSVHIEGYVNAVERDSNIINVPSVGRCVEQIRAGVFDKALSSGADVSILENHDNSRRLGSISEGNLKLYEDNIGLRAIADIVDADIADKARRKLLKGWSFGFICTENEIEQRAGNVPRRIVKGMDLSEVSLIDGSMKPCYSGTSVEVRADGVIREFRAADDDNIEYSILDSVDNTSTDAENAPVDSTADGEDVESRSEEPDYSYYDAMLRYLELRYNPYHDPGNGRFCSGGGGGGGSGDYLFVVPEGQKGKGVLVKDMNISDKKIASAYYHAVYNNSSINGETPTGLNPNPAQKKVVNGANQYNTTVNPGNTVGEKFGVSGGAGTAYTIVTIDGKNVVVRNDYIAEQANGKLIISQKSLAKSRQSGIIDVTAEIQNSAHSAEPDSIAGVSKGKPMTFDEADNGKANPNYSTGTYGVTHNCQTVVKAHEARMRGYDVEAKAKSSQNGYQRKLSYDTTAGYIDPKTGKPPKMTNISSLNPYKEINSSIKPGERHEIEYAHRHGGHIITASRDENNQLRLYDPQTNMKVTGESQINSYFHSQSAHKIKSLRVDNLDFNENVVNNVLKKAGK